MREAAREVAEQLGLRDVFVNVGDTLRLAVVERMALVAPSSPAVWYEAATLNSELGQIRRARTCLEAVARFDHHRRFAGAADELSQRLKARLN